MKHAAHSYSVSFCANPCCGLHLIAHDERGDTITEIVMSIEVTLDMIKFAQDELYEKATRRN